jgi:hypothetical protein
MSHTPAGSIPVRRVATSRRSRAAFVAAAALCLLLAPLSTSGAQDAISNTVPSTRPWTLRFTSGALVATGDQRNSFKDAQLSAAGLSWRVLPSLSITGTFSWARSRALDVAGRGKVDVFTSDLGVEAETKTWSPSAAVRFKLFAGTGAGVRSYNYRNSAEDAAHHPAGYLAVGGDVSVGRMGLRLEARDYASRFTSPAGARTTDTRNDLVISAGLYFKKRSAAAR